jgi:hypothetical protein
MSRIAQSEMAARRLHRSSLIVADEIMTPCSHERLIPLSGKTRIVASRRALPVRKRYGMIATTEIKAAKPIAPSTGRF